MISKKSMLENAIAKGDETLIKYVVMDCHTYQIKKFPKDLQKVCAKYRLIDGRFNNYGGFYGER